MQRKNISVRCSSDQNPQDLACEYRQDVQWVYIDAATDTIVASCGDYTITFFCKDGDDDTRQYTKQNVLVGLGFYAHTLDVPEEIFGCSATGISYNIEWPKVTHVDLGIVETHVSDRSQRPILSRAD